MYQTKELGQLKHYQCDGFVTLKHPGQLYDRNQLVCNNVQKIVLKA